MKIIRIAVFVGLAALAINAARMTISQAEAQAQPVTALPSGSAVTPYTVILAETVTGKSRQRVGPGQTWAQRRDGAIAYKISEGILASRNVVLPDGTRIELNDALKAKSTIVVPHDTPWLRDPIHSCARLPHHADPNAPSTTGVTTFETLKGHRAAKITLGRGTTWYALDVGCATIQHDVAYEEGGSSHLELVSLIAGEPSASLFDIGVGYKEGPPSALALPVTTKCDADCLKSRQNRFERIDANYFKYHVPAK